MHRLQSRFEDLNESQEYWERKINIPAQAIRQEGLNSSYSPFLFFSDLSGLDDSHSHWEGHVALLSSLTQMLISSRSILTSISRKKVKPNIWAFCGPVKLTDKINHHTQWVCGCCPHTLAAGCRHVTCTGPLRCSCLGLHMWRAWAKRTSQSHLTSGCGRDWLVKHGYLGAPNMLIFLLIF